MITMKKQFAIALSAALLTLTACGTPSDQSAAVSSSASSSVSSAAASSSAVSDSSADTSASTADVSQPDSEESSQETSADASTSQPDSDVETLAPVEQTTAPQQSAPTAEPQTASEPEPESQPEPQAEAPAPTKEQAMAYIGQSVSSMISAIGAPNSSSYAPSCLGAGEDGELLYDGFTVYTYREGGNETVQDVL